MSPDIALGLLVGITVGGILGGVCMTLIVSLFAYMTYNYLCSYTLVMTHSLYTQQSILYQEYLSTLGFTPIDDDEIEEGEDDEPQRF